MVKKVRREDVNKLIGKEIFAVKKDGTTVSGKLVQVKGNTIILAPKKGKKVQTKAIIPLVLFDLLAIGTSPFGFGGGYGYGYGGGYPYGGYGYGGPIGYGGIW